MFGPISFRRILLSRILLLSVPVLLIGQFVTYRQVRLSLLETMHDSLVQSAQRKGEDLSRFVTTLRLSASVAREALPVTAGDFSGSEVFFERLIQQLPDSVECIWLESIATKQVLANTCAAIDASVPTYQPITVASDPPSNFDRPEDAIEIRTFFMSVNSEFTARSASIKPPENTPEETLENTPAETSENTPAEKTNTQPIASESKQQTYFLLNAPVTPLDGTSPQYVLRLIAQLPSEHRNEIAFNAFSSDLLSNATLIVNASNAVLSYPLSGYVGHTFNELPDYTRLVQQTQESSTEFAQRTVLSASIFSLDDQTRQAIVGHVLIPDPTIPLNRIDPANPMHPEWIVMAVADLDLALENLAGIRSVMLNLVLLLLAANLAATLFLTWDLARPLERLGRYARNIECNLTPEALPARFSIQEFNQLAVVMNASIERLKSWANELSAAWQNARQANQLKNEFLTTISHELRTPLNGIIGSIRLIRDGFCEDRAEELEFLQRADDSALHLLAIIDDILDISKIEAGTVTIAPEVIDLRQTVREAIELQQHEIDTKALDLSLDLGETQTMVYVDPSKLRRVLVNILGNAVKFTEIGQITIAIETRTPTLTPTNTDRPARAGLYAAIEVSDTGIGIDPRVQDKLFEPFVMVDGTTTRQFGGTGLGLAISRNLLEMMDGYIAINSLGLNRGATVTIEIPLSNAIVNQSNQPALASPASSLETSGESIEN
jgi:signal transduction histidine kinase